MKNGYGVIQQLVCKDCGKIFPESFDGMRCDNCGGELTVKTNGQVRSLNSRLANKPNLK